MPTAAASAEARRGRGAAGADTWLPELVEASAAIAAVAALFGRWPVAG